MSKYTEPAKDLLEHIGGSDNVSVVTHCATRMRFVLKDSKQADVEKIEAIPLVKGTFTQAGQFQVIIGNEVPSFYNEFTKIAGVNETSKDDAKEAAKQNMSFLQRMIAHLADIFTPLIPALVVGGLILGFRNVINDIKLIDDGTKALTEVSQFWAGTHAFLWLIGEAIFHFLPVGITWAIARKMGTTPILGIILGITLVSPQLLNAYGVPGAEEIPFWDFGFAQINMNKGGGWNALFWCNHDQPRAVSRFGNDEQYHKESAKMLATTIHTMQGTPYIYQGEEFGMTDPKFDKIDDYRDVESINMFEIMKSRGMKEEEILEILKQKSRDNSRTPMQWNDGENAGFTKGTPWIGIPNNYKEINAEKAMADPDSIFYHYQKLIQLRKEYDIIIEGDYQWILEDHPEIFAYVRNGEHEKLLVINNFYGRDTRFELPEDLKLADYQSEILISNYKDSPTDFVTVPLRPYESIVYHLRK